MVHRCYFDERDKEMAAYRWLVDELGVCATLADHEGVTPLVLAIRFNRPVFLEFFAQRADFDAEAYTWALRAQAGFSPQLIEGGQAPRAFRSAQGACPCDRFGDTR